MVRDVKHLKLPRKEDFFDYWLELQYGWKPLLSDVHGAISLLNDREKDADRGLVTVKSGIKSKDYFERNISDSTAGFVFSTRKTHKVEYKAFIRLDFVPSDAPLTQSLSQLGITNPLSLAWELLPWSFVADWFVPIGDYLSSLDATVGWEFKGGSYSCKTTMVTKAVSCSYTQAANPGMGSLTGSCSPQGEGRQYSFSRKAYSSAPLPSLPNLSKVGRASPGHVQNGIALLMSAIVGGSKVR
jgi:hypothetical protein